MTRHDDSHERNVLAVERALRDKRCIGPPACVPALDAHAWACPSLRPGHRRPPGELRRCDECGEVFACRTHHQRYCSPACNSRVASRRYMRRKRSEQVS